MYLERKYKFLKIKVAKAEKNRQLYRSPETWLEIRNLKKQKLIFKDALTFNKAS
jgi:uncharacterized protein YdcH (DUF465 family)